MVTQDKFNDIVTFFFHLQVLNKLYHWNTTSFGRHKATDGFNENFLDLIDKFIEVFIGTYNMKPHINDIKINNDYMTDEGIVKLFVFTKKYLKSFDSMIDSTDLLNIRDEILAEVNKTLYLFRLN
jgi:hypothetical protein